MDAAVISTIASQTGPIVDQQVAASIAADPTVASAAAAAAETALQSAQVNAAACFADSMMADHGNLGVTVPSILAEELGIPVFAGGVGGQTSTEIAVRQGGLDVFSPSRTTPFPRWASV